MNKKKIVFILNSIQIQRVVKRINSFYDAGYDIEVYGFDRIGVSPCGLKPHFKFNLLGEFPNNMPYFKRLALMRKCIKTVAPHIKDQNCILYLFGLDVALVTKTVLNIRYIYEEADLVHTYIPNSIIRRFLEWCDVRIIKKSLRTVFTSEGFAIYHFGEYVPSNIIIISNKLNPAVVDLPKKEKKLLDVNHLNIGFVGSFRFNSVFNFCRVLVEKFPQHELHVYGTMPEANICKELLSHSNFIFHGPFMNPDDLPDIYANIDLSLSTYDATTVNAQYAEPNKMYETIYFETPIIVSKGTYLEQKVKKQGIGYAIDAMNDEEVVDFIGSITEESLSNTRKRINAIKKSSAINQPEELFQQIGQFLD